MRSPLLAALCCVLSSACGSPCPAGTEVCYEVTFQGTWTETTHPVDYPSGSALDPNSAHFSGIIGAAHNASYRLFDVGELATEGLITLAHTGVHSPLDEELRAAA